MLQWEPPKSSNKRASEYIQVKIAVNNRHGSVDKRIKGNTIHLTK